MENLKNQTKEMDILSVFGLTEKQTALMFSLQRACAINDKDDSPTKKEEKEGWINEWSKSLYANKGERDLLIRKNDSLIKEFRNELNSTTSKTWFNLIILEAVVFKPYFPLGDETKDKTYKLLSYSDQIKYIKSFISFVGYEKPEIADIYSKVYKQSLATATGQTEKMIIGILSALLVAALTAVTAGLLAPVIAVALVGEAFAGLSGAALVSACLAYIGGGAIAAGGLGMAGGFATIVGGGALFGAVVGAAGNAGINALFGSSPKIALTFAAKLNVVLREIILNEQRDTILAATTIDRLQQSVVSLTARIKDLELKQKKDLTQIKNLKESVDYMERILKDMTKFSSSFEIGLSSGAKA